MEKPISDGKTLAAGNMVQDTRAVVSTRCRFISFPLSKDLNRLQEETHIGDTAERLTQFHQSLTRDRRTEKSVAFSQKYLLIFSSYCPKCSDDEQFLFVLSRAPVKMLYFEFLSRQEHFARLFDNNSRFFDTSKDTHPNNTLNKLRENADQALAIDKQLFREFLDCILSAVEFSQGDYSLAIIMACNFAGDFHPPGKTFLINTNNLPAADNFRMGLNDGRLPTFDRDLHKEIKAASPALGTTTRC